MRWWSILVLSLAACGAEDERAVTVAAPPERDFTFELPTSWHLFTESQTPALTNPVEILSAGTVPARGPDDRSCAHIPVSALEAMGPDDAFVTVQERYGEPRFPARPVPFRLPPKTGYTDAQACARNGDELDIHWFGFRDARRGFHVLVVFGHKASPERRDEVLALLDSLRFEPGPQGVHLDPDLAVASEDAAAGLRWQMPVPPWRSYGSAADRLLLGTFELEGTPDDPCAPPAIPPGDAFIYVVELGPDAGYECPGDSRMVRWRDGGRAFQAHVYLGERAGAALERDARSILNSIQTFTDRIPSGS
jgi:hypothetical protein